MKVKLMPSIIGLISGNFLFINNFFFFPRVTKIYAQHNINYGTALAPKNDLTEVVPRVWLLNLESGTIDWHVHRWAPAFNGSICKQNINK